MPNTSYPFAALLAGALVLALWGPTLTPVAVSTAQPAAAASRAIA